MVRKLLLALVVLVVLALAAAGYGYLSGAIRPPQLERVTLSWGEVTPATTTINAAINVNNGLPFGLGSGTVGIEVPIYLNNVQGAQFDLPALSLPKGSSTLNASATLIQAALPQWWAGFVQQGEVLAVRIQPHVKARVIGAPLSAALPAVQTRVPISIMSKMGSKEPTTMGFDASVQEVLRNPSQHFRASPPPPAPIWPVLTMESWELHWGNVTPEATQVLGTIVLRNELPVSLPIQGLRIGLDMNGIRVIPDVNITPPRPELPSGASVPLALQANIDNGKLVQWWTSHLQRKEETVATARLGAAVVLPSALGLGLTQPVPLPLVPVPGVQCRIRSDIMGIANYQIAQMLGKPAGPEPKATQVECSMEPPRLASVEPLPTSPVAPILPPPVPIPVAPTPFPRLTPPSTLAPPVLTPAPTPAATPAATPVAPSTPAALPVPAPARALPLPPPPGPRAP